MPSPSTSAPATLRPDLAGSFMEFDLEANALGMIGTRVLTVVESQKQSGTFGKIPIEQLLKPRNTARAPGAGYNRGEFKFETVTFATEEHGVEEPVDDREATMYAEYFDAEQVSAARARNDVLKAYEIRVKDAVFNTATWTGASLTTAITNEWDDHTNATPISDVLAAKLKVFTNSGLIANTLIIGYTVFENLKNCTQIIDRIKYSGLQNPNIGAITVEAVAQALGIEFLLVGGMVTNGANEGQAASVSAVWGTEYGMICRTETSSDIRRPCIGRTIHWGEDGSSIGGVFETYRDERVRSNIVRNRMDTDELILYTEAGHLLSNLTT